MSKTIFNDDLSYIRHPNSDARFSYKILEDEIKALIDRKLGNANAPLADKSCCKTFVLAAYKTNLANLPHRLRTYRTPISNPSTCTIWEASRATTAAPTFFDPITIEKPGEAKITFVDPGIARCNNPSLQALQEARDIWGPQTQFQCFISIGTGGVSIAKLKDHESIFGRMFKRADTYLKLAYALKEIATDCKATHENMERVPDLEDVYSRFNVETGLDSVGLEEANKEEEISTFTNMYLEDRRVVKMRRNCAKLLLGNNSLGEYQH